MKSSKRLMAKNNGVSTQKRKGRMAKERNLVAIVRDPALRSGRGRFSTSRALKSNDQRGRVAVSHHDIQNSLKIDCFSNLVWVCMSGHRVGAFFY